MSKKGKIIFALIIGFAAAIIIMSVFIYFGYSKAYGILVMPIYELMRIGDKFAGVSIGQNMGIICGICMSVSLAVEEIIHKIRRK